MTTDVDTDALRQAFKCLDVEGVDIRVATFQGGDLIEYRVAIYYRNSLVWTGGGTMAAITPKTTRRLFSMAVADILSRAIVASP